MSTNTTDIEKCLRGAADDLRANSRLKSWEYSMRASLEEEENEDLRGVLLPGSRGAQGED